MRRRRACSHQAVGKEDASHPGGLKDEVRTPQTQTGAQRRAHPPDPQQAVSSSSASQDPHLLAGPAGGRRTPEKHHTRVRGWRGHSGEDVKLKLSPPPTPAELDSTVILSFHWISVHLSSVLSTAII